MCAIRFCAGIFAAMLSMSAPIFASSDKDADAALEAAIAGAWRSAEARARDEYRNPAETLKFWGLRPGMTVLEVQPGGTPWWTEILAPYARMTGGTFYATGANLADPGLSDAARRGREAFEARYAERPEIYGEVRVVDWGPGADPLPAETFDLIVTARSAHGWVRAGRIDDVFAEFYRALKPGGTLGLKQHRADPETYDPGTFTGYLPEALIIEHAEKAGFRLVGRSEINANPRDTRDHPFGVWTLPPVRASAPYGSGEAPAPGFDRTHYDAIGESDRMTLKLEKPADATAGGGNRSVDDGA
jgi:predicted methyltransferase